MRVPPWVVCFFPGVFLSSRVTGACPVTTDLIMRVNVRTTTTTSCVVFTRVPDTHVLTTKGLFEQHAWYSILFHFLSLKFERFVKNCKEVHKKKEKLQTKKILGWFIYTFEVFYEGPSAIFCCTSLTFSVSRKK